MREEEVDARRKRSEAERAAQIAREKVREADDMAKKYWAVSHSNEWGKGAVGAGGAGGTRGGGSIDQRGVLFYCEGRLRFT